MVTQQMDPIPLDISDSVTRLREVIPHLNMATDRAVKIVNQLETLLNDKLSVGTYAAELIWTYRVHESSSRNEYKSLEYRRYKDKYRIVIVEGYNDDEASRITPVAECSRDTKLEAVEKLAELIDAITVAVDNRVETAAAVNDNLTTIVKAID